MELKPIDYADGLIPPADGIIPGDPLHTECRDGVAFVERAWPGELTNPGGPSARYARPGDVVRVGDANWRVSDRPRKPSAVQHANPREIRCLYASAILDMPAGPARRAELRQMLVDMLDVVEQSTDEAPLIAALKAYDDVASKLRAPLDERQDAQTSGRPSARPEVAAVALAYQRLIPRKYTAEESAAIQRDVDAAFAGGFAPFGGPIPTQPDPSKIIGVVGQRPQDPDYPPIPPAGFYWAKCSCDPERWQPVEVTENHGRHFVAIIGDEGSQFIAVEWGPKLEPPGSAASAPWQRMTYEVAQEILRSMFKPIAVVGKDLERLAEQLDRVTVQPSECTHEAWKSPVTRCPTCGTEER